MRKVDAATAIAMLAAAGTLSAGAWRQIPLPPESVPVHGLAAHGDTLWAGLDDGVRSSVDGGKTWSAPGTGPEAEAGEVIGLAHAGPRLIACRKRLLSVSEDGGRTWTGRDTSVTLLNTGLESRGDTLFAPFTLFAGPHPDGSRISVDGGLSWSAPAYGLFPGAARLALPGKTYFHVGGTTLYLDSGSAPVPVLSVPEGIQRLEAAGGTLYVLTRSGVCIAAQGGDAPWKFIGVAERAASVLAVAADADRIAVQTRRGISLSADSGRTWGFLRLNPHRPDSGRLAVGNGTLYAYAYDSDLIHRYDIASKAWDSLSGSRPYAHRTLAVNGDRVALGGMGDNGNFALRLSLDRGATFGDPRNQTATQLGGPVLLAWGADRLYAASDWTLSVSRDSGRTWKSSASSCGVRPIGFAAEDTVFYQLFDRGASSVIAISQGCASLQPPAGAGNAQDLAAADGNLYLATDAGLWMWEKEGAVSLGRRTGSAARRASPPLPVRTWRAPRLQGLGDAGARFDATGALRRQEPEPGP